MDIYREMEKIEEGGKSADKADIERIHKDVHTRPFHTALMVQTRSNKPIPRHHACDGGNT